MPLELLTAFGLIVIYLVVAAVHLRSSARELEAALDEAQKANRHKDQFISTISHELRTPLTSITTSIRMLLMGLLGDMSDKAKTALTISDSNAKMLNSLVEDLLLMGTMDSGNLELHRRPTDVNELLRSAVENFGGYADVQEVSVDVKTAEQPAVADIDVRKIQQVIANLLSNAAKFSPAGGVVRAEVETDGDKIRISVSDNGIGIPEGRQEDVFGRFRQVDTGDKRKHNGSGVGLSISQDIVKAHGGLLDYESELGVGSRFFVELDRHQTDPEDVLAAA